MNDLHQPNTITAPAKTLSTAGQIKGLKHCMECLTGAANVKCFGAIGDGQSHPLAERFDSLEQAQWCFPHAQDLNEEIDWAAIQTAINAEQSIFVPPGEYLLGNNSLTIDGAKHLVGVGTDATTIPIGKDTGSSAAFITIWDDSGPDINISTIGGWELGGGNAKVVFHRINREHDEETYFNDSDNWKRVLRLTKDNILTDIEIADPAKGLIMADASGQRYRIVVDNTTTQPQLSLTPI